jgi:CHAD domain-containing protein
MRATRRSGRAAAHSASSLRRVDASLGDVLERRVRALDDDLLASLKGDVDAVHKARVATRRLREAVPLTLRRGKGHRLVKRLKQLTRALGPLRELDVALASLADRVGRRRGEGLAALRRHLERERKAALARLRDAMDRPRAQRLLERLGKQVRRARDGGAAEALAAHARKVLPGRAVDQARRLHEAVAAAGAIFVVERVHAVRIEAKRLRYALELAGELRLARTALLVARLKRVQDILGELHDLDVLRAHATVVHATGGPHGHSPDLVALAAALEDDARHLHARYLRRARALVLLTDRVRDRMAPCLDPSASTSSATPSPKSAVRPGPTTASVRSRPRASASGGGRRRDSSRSTPGPI